MDYNYVRYDNHPVRILSNLLSDSGARKQRGSIRAQGRAKACLGPQNWVESQSRSWVIRKHRRQWGQVTEGPAAFLHTGCSFLRSRAQRTVAEEEGGYHRALSQPYLCSICIPGGVQKHALRRFPVPR